MAGFGGLHFEKVKDNHLNTWALEGQAMNYGETMLAQGGQYVAIVDTGSSQIAVPPKIFEGLKENWKKTLPSIDCQGHEIFCFVDQSC